MTNPESSEGVSNYDIGEALKELEDSINKDNDFLKYISPEIKDVVWMSQIPKDLWSDFVEKFNSFYKWEKVLHFDYGEVDSDLISNIFWNLQPETKNIITSNLDLVFLFYIKKICPNNYEAIFFYFKSIYDWIWEDRNNIYATNNRDTYYDVIKVIKKHWDNSLKYFKYCNCYNKAYVSEGALSFWDNVKYPAAVNFWEIFVEEDESANLFEYLSLYPTKLKNLGWNIIKEIDLDVNKWVVFCFRGILEMVKSRSDFEFPPYLNESASDAEKQERKLQRDNIIKEYETMLRNYISRDFEIDGNWERIQKPRNKSFDKIFYTHPDWDEIIDEYHTDENTLKGFTQNEISEYSFKVDPNQNEEYYEKTGAENEEAEQVSKKLLLDIETYVKSHPNEKILVCVDQHGWLDWSSRNGWKKEDWIKLANLSPNIKIWSIRCFFWRAYDNKDIYTHQSSVSWFSNKTVTQGFVTNVISSANEMGLWFHEMEIYTRLNYFFGATPLTESMEYIDRNTGETKTSKMGLARNGNQSDVSPGVSYA